MWHLASPMFPFPRYCDLGGCAEASGILGWSESGLQSHCLCIPVQDNGVTWLVLNEKILMLRHWDYRVLCNCVFVWLILQFHLIQLWTYTIFLIWEFFQGLLLITLLFVTQKCEPIFWPSRVNKHRWPIIFCSCQHFKTLLPFVLAELSSECILVFVSSGSSLKWVLFLTCLTFPSAILTMTRITTDDML